jgi:hypothetical protein
MDVSKAPGNSGVVMSANRAAASLSASVRGDTGGVRGELDLDETLRTARASSTPALLRELADSAKERTETIGETSSVEVRFKSSRPATEKVLLQEDARVVEDSLLLETGLRHEKGL